MPSAIRQTTLLWGLGAAFAGADVVAAVSDRFPATTAQVRITPYLAALAVALTFVSVRLPTGYLTMSGVATSAAALSLPPRLAMLVGVTSGLVGAVAISRAPLALRPAQLLAAGVWTSVAALTTQGLQASGAPRALALLAGVVAWTLANWALTGSIGSVAYRISPWAVIRRNINRHWLGAFAYFGVSGIILSSVLDGSYRSFVLGTLIACLSLALADSVAGRQLRLKLIEQITDVDRHLLHSRVVEGTIHNVRNSLAVGIGYLGEAATGPAGDHTELAVQAIRDAVEALNRLQMGSSPRVEWFADAIDLTGLAEDVCTLATSQADQKRVHILCRDANSGLLIRGDPMLLRQVITNLVLNAIEAVATGGHVWVTTGMRANRVFMTVTDDGPGVPDKYRERLFEPHFTTKPSGTGIGLFVSYGIIREHRGELLYEGSKKGAVFTVLLPAA